MFIEVDWGVSWEGGAGTGWSAQFNVLGGVCCSSGANSMGCVLESPLAPLSSVRGYLSLMPSK